MLFGKSCPLSYLLLVVGLKYMTCEEFIHPQKDVSGVCFFVGNKNKGIIIIWNCYRLIMIHGYFEVAPMVKIRNTCSLLFFKKPKF